MYYDKFSSTDETIKDVIEILKSNGLVEPNDVIINTGTMPLHDRRRTNMLKVSIVEE
jgi:pyruvate kinase